MNKPLIKNIMLYIGIIAIFTAGMLFVLLADWMLTIQSLWLMLAILLSVGSMVCATLSERYRDRPTTMYVLKGVAVGLTVCLITFFVVYLSIALAPAQELAEGASSFEKSFAIKSAIGTKRSRVYTLIVFIIVLAISAISLIAQATDIALTATTKDE